MRKVVSLLVLGVACLLAATMGGVAGKGQDASQLQKPLEYQVNVTLKLVQVYVTDKKGHPVPDLTKDDFIVSEDGRPVTVTEFEKHLLEPPSSSAPGAAKSDKSSAVLPVTRSFFLLFDFAFNNQRGITKGKEAAVHFIDTELKPGDSVGLLSYSMFNGLAVHEFLTSNRKKIREDILNLSEKGIAGRAEDIEERYWRQATEGLDIDWLRIEPDHPEMVSPTRKDPPIFNWRRQESKNLAENFFIKITALAKALRYVPGQKHFLFFTSGVTSTLIYGNQEGNPLDTNTAYTTKPIRSEFDLGDPILKTQSEQMLKELAASNCAIYTFDTREAALVPSLFTYDEQTFEERKRDMFYDEGVHANVTNPLKDDRVTGMNSLLRLSSFTGGKYYSNINKYKKNLDDVETITGTYYVLGYAIPKTADGKYHELKVEVKRERCVIKAQAGYFNPKPFPEFTDLEKQLHLFDLALSERPVFQVPVPFTMSPLSYTADAEGRLELLAKIPVQVIAKFIGRKVEIISLVFDERENLASLRRKDAELTRYAGMDVYLAFGTALAPGPYSCRIIIRDLETGESARASISVFAKKKSPTGLTLGSPLLLVPKSNFAYIESEVSAGSPLSWKDLYPYERSMYSPLLGDITISMPEIYAVVPCSVVDITRPDVSITASLIDAETGARALLPSSVVKKTTRGDAEIEFLKISVEGVPPGKYVLYLLAEDAVSKAVAFTQIGLVISQ